ncbi:MAG: glycerol-3-phosphate 1-O-acyltransferase PlsY [Ruminococcaceae bacterium]|nr:glycerol-3-phosphate 1-O-acyltransferase PlsY [Oscillospiraceae bacterium]
MLTLLTAVNEITVYHKIAAVAAVAVSSYLLGSICFAIIVTYIFTKEDIRKKGSGNAGTANVFRSVGPAAGILTGLFDFLKGVLAVYIGYNLFKLVGFERYTGGTFAALLVLIGHLYPVFFKYRGGKGVMTMGGILIILNYKVFLVLLVIYLLTFLIWRITSVSGLVSAALLPVVNAVICIIEEKYWINTTVFFAISTVLIFYAHRENIKRLMEGRENKLKVKKKDK